MQVVESPQKKPSIIPPYADTMAKVQTTHSFIRTKTSLECQTDTVDPCRSLFAFPFAPGIEYTATLGVVRRIELPFLKTILA